MISNSVSTPQALMLALKGFFFALVLALFSLVNFRIGPLTIDCALASLAAVYFWPYRANYLWSLWGVVFAGLFLDMISGGPIGLWTLINCALFISFDPAGEMRKLGLLGHCGFFAMFLAIALTLAFLLGRVSLGAWPSASLLLIQYGVALCLFPFIYATRQFLRRIASGQGQVEV